MNTADAVRVPLQLNGKEIGCILELIKSKQEEVGLTLRRRALSVIEKAALEDLAGCLGTARSELERALGRRPVG